MPVVDEDDLVESAGERHDLSLRLVDATLCGALDVQPADAGPDPLDDAGRIGTPPEIVAQQLMDDTALGLRNDPLDELDAAFALEVEVDRTIRTTIGAPARLVEWGVGQGPPSQARDVVVALLDRVQDADIRVESAPDEPVDRREPAEGRLPGQHIDGVKGEPVAPVIRANSDASLCDEALRRREIGVGIDGETDSHRAGTLPSRGQFHRQGSEHLVEKGLELCLVDVVLRDIRRGREEREPGLDGERRHEEKWEAGPLAARPPSRG